MTTTKTPVPDVSDDPQAAVAAALNDPGEREKTDGEKYVEQLTSRLPDDFGPLTFRARPTPFLFACSDPDKDNGVDYPVVPYGRVVLLTGGGGAGKSHLSLSLAVTLATGLPIGSLYVPPLTLTRHPRARVLVVFGEETLSEVTARLDAVCRSVRFKTSSSGEGAREGLDASMRERVRDRVEIIAGCGRDLRLTNREGDPLPLADRVVERIKGAARDGDPYVLVVLDPMTRFNGADENDNAAAARMVTTLERLTNDTRTTVIAVHHSGKGESAATNARGASALVDNARCHLALARVDGGVSELSIEKSNYGPLSHPADEPHSPGYAPRLWFRFQRPADASVYTLQEVDRNGRSARRATIKEQRIEAKVAAKLRNEEETAEMTRRVDAYKAAAKAAAKGGASSPAGDPFDAPDPDVP
jgi:KaiC/GvpD/RAD55 family RecA-like ATPase